MRLFFTIGLIIFSLTIQAQKVGLVLSGGGARGLVHIGLIKALEEHGIPIDFITGTSMGAIVGGLYSLGYTPEQMIEEFETEEFYYWSKGIIPSEFIYYYKKPEENASMFSVSLDLKEGKIKPRIQPYLIPTHQMDIAFMQIFTQGIAKANYNFDSLFIPFRAVAANIYKKEPHIFRDGDLGLAIRASMTFPFFFRPITIDGIPLFDGGIYNNFPWDIMVKDFKPDIIIGSNVSQNPPPPDELSIISQLEHMIMSITDFDLPDTLGIVIDTDINELSLLDFSSVREIVDIGYKHTMEKIDSIKTLITRRVYSEDLLPHRRKFLNNQPELVFGNVNITGINEHQRHYIRKSLKHLNDSLTLYQFKKDYFKLVFEPHIDRIFPNALYNEKNNKFDLNLNVTLEPKYRFSVGGNISSGNLNQGFFAAGYKHLGRAASSIDLNSYFGRLYSSVQFSIRQDYPFRIPIFMQFKAILNRTDYFSSSSDPFFEDTKPAYLIKKESFLSFQAGTPIRTNAVLRVSANFGENDYEYYQTDSFLKDDYPDHTYFNLSNIGITYERNSLNHILFPTRGKKRLVRLGYVSGREDHLPGTTSQTFFEDYLYHDWYTAKFYNHSYHRIFRKRLHLGVLIDVTYTNRPFFVNYSSTILNTPAFTPNFHSKTIFNPNLHSDFYGGIGIMPIINITEDLHIRTEGYLFQPYKSTLRDKETYKPYHSKPLENRYFFGSASLVYSTPIGPLSFSLNYYPDLPNNYYFIFNFGYLLFNRSSLE